MRKFGWELLMGILGQEERVLGSLSDGWHTMENCSCELTSTVFLKLFYRMD